MKELLLELRRELVGRLADGDHIDAGAHGLRCWERHGTKRRAEAEAALAGLGVKP